jgi:hypothetical protein
MRVQSKAVPMKYYTVRFPIEWEDRIEAIHKHILASRPSDIIQVSTCAVVRQAYRIGAEELLRKYGQENPR